MSKTQFEHLFSPLQVGPMRVPNRICETTNTINSSMIPGEIDDELQSAPWRQGPGRYRLDRQRNLAAQPSVSTGNAG